MIDIARETLVLRREGILPSLSLLIPTFAFPEAPVVLEDGLRRRRNAPLPCLATSTASVKGLCPIIIHAKLLD